MTLSDNLFGVRLFVQFFCVFICRDDLNDFFASHIYINFIICWSHVIGTYTSTQKEIVIILVLELHLFEDHSIRPSAHHNGKNCQCFPPYPQNKHRTHK